MTKLAIPIELSPPSKWVGFDEARTFPETTTLSVHTHLLDIRGGNYDVMNDAGEVILRGKCQFASTILGVDCTLTDAKGDFLFKMDDREADGHLKGYDQKDNEIFWLARTVLFKVKPLIKVKSDSCTIEWHVAIAQHPEGPQGLSLVFDNPANPVDMGMSGTHQGLELVLIGNEYDPLHRDNWRGESYIRTNNEVIGWVSSKPFLAQERTVVITKNVDYTLVLALVIAVDVMHPVIR
ncbi:uncharacterized protein IL334_003717 [Kwoniella shivajii]|uniref:Uncharacterized protein n=1 Tax=Kwoniella shivajii TaxID=564305 RepID=A0ABZ1D043_9TREE|nr:hypothetical protein IL334_003717 [Kwoniella shivajii]